MDMDKKNNKEERKVSHNYHDYALASAEEVSHLVSSSSGKPCNPHFAGGQQLGFAVKLHFMLSQVEMHGDTSIVSWQPHGRQVCFRNLERSSSSSSSFAETYHWILSPLTDFFLVAVRYRCFVVHNRPAFVDKVLPM